MTRLTTALTGGLAGAVALTVLHELVRRLDPDAPRMDVLGEEAITKGLHRAGREAPRQPALFNLTLAGDVLSNALFYSLAGIGSRKGHWSRGAALGAAAGLGGVVLPKYLGLDTAPTNRSNKTRLMTIGWYLFGGLVASGVMSLLQRRDPAAD